MIYIYNFVINLFYFILLPFLLVFRRQEILSRSAINLPDLHKSIWIHAASVGEINAAKDFILGVQTIYPEYNIVISTTTKTGLETAENISPTVAVFLYPIDLNFFIRRIFKTINPQMLIILETEFWPNMLFSAKKNKIPIYIINGRITKNSFLKYQKTLFFWKPLFKAVNKVGVQSEIDLIHYNKLGFNNVEITRNLKFSVKLAEYDKNLLRIQWKIGKDDFVIVFGSSRPGEEKLVKDLFPTLKSEIKNLKMIVCPRHLNRLEDVKSIFNNEDLTFFSDLKENYNLLIIDKMGILAQAYAISDISIVGGSFFDFTGHNPLEPAFYGKAIIMGEYFSSCRNSVEKLLEKGGIIISNPENLKNDIITLANNGKKRKYLGNQAKSVLTENADSLQNNLNLIRNIL